MDENDDTQHLIRTQADLEQLWRTLMGPLGFTRTSVWVILIGADDVPVRRLAEIDAAGGPPGEKASQQVADLLRELVPGDHRVAFLRTRPGRGRPDRGDRRWAYALYATARAAAVACDVVHVANDERLVPVPLDELALRRGA